MKDILSKCSRLQVTSCRLACRNAVKAWLQIAGCKFQVTGCKFQVPSCKDDFEPFISTQHPIPYTLYPAPSTNPIPPIPYTLYPTPTTNPIPPIHPINSIHPIHPIHPIPPINLPILRKSFIYTIIILGILLQFFQLHADEYYWVGDQGNWSDINHWATSSGGSVLHIQSPTAADNVYFDANSFQTLNDTISINQKNAVCLGMDWQGVANSPILAGLDTTSLRIYGSLRFDQGMILNYDGIIFFEATSPGQTITSDGTVFSCDIILQGNGGGWLLSDDFSSEHKVELIRGTFNTVNFDFECNSFVSTHTEAREILLGTSTMIVLSWSVNGSNLLLDADESYFRVGSSMTTTDGGRFIYDDVDFIGQAGGLASNNVYTVYDNVKFNHGNVSGDCTIDSLIFNGNGVIIGSDSINYVKIVNAGHVEGASVIKYFDCDFTCTIEEDNIIDEVYIDGNASIFGNNVMDTVFLKNMAVIAGGNQINYVTVIKQAWIFNNNFIHWGKLKEEGFIKGTNEFDILIFTEGKTYTFGINSVTTINNEFNATGTCYQPIRMLSDTNGVQATIIKNNGPFVSEYLSLRDLKAEGDVPFIAAHSVDLGNNANWGIDTSPPLDLFWVNGHGYWSDGQHWDIVSGGAGGHCPPTEIDNAIFDENSFSGSDQDVIIDVENAVCHDMNWEGVSNFAPNLTGMDTLKLRIYGSLYFKISMDNKFYGDIFFEAIDTGQIIRMDHSIIKANAWFVGRGGYWALEDDFFVTNNIYFQIGGIHTLGNEISCQEFSSTDTTTRYLNLGTSTVKLYDSDEYVWDMSADSLTLKADSSLLIAYGKHAKIRTFDALHKPYPVYNNVEFYEISSMLVNLFAHCTYNLVTFFENSGEVRGNCNIDTVTFHKINGEVHDNDTIKTAIFHETGGLIKGGEHVIEIAYFYKDGTVIGNNIIDTALFYRNAYIADTNYIDTTIVYNRTQIEGLNTFRTATLKGDGNINGENTFNDLTLTKTKTYYFENGKTQTIIDNFNLEGACTGPIIMQSDENTYQATLHKVNGPVEGDYLSLRDIKATGSELPFTAYNSVDLGNNTDWEILISTPKELYWVNGTGVWSDSLHWSGTSGGDGGYCIPTPIDNVYFDENSFDNMAQACAIDLGNATCHNMDWTGAIENSVLAGADTNNLRIYGSLKFNPLMNYSFSGPVFFETTEPDHIIESHGVSINNDVTFQGIGGEWKLIDNFRTYRTLDFKHGSLDLDENELKCKTFLSPYINPRLLDISNATVIVTGANDNAWHLNIVNLDFDGSGSVIRSLTSNGVIRTEGTGNITYNDVFVDAATSRIYSLSTRTEYSNIFFYNDGSVHGNCIIDSLVFDGSGGIYDSDTINYAHIHGAYGLMMGGSHVVNTILFDNNGTIIGNNTIDSTIIYGAGEIEGTNHITKSLIIGKKAIITGQNNLSHTILMGNGTINSTNNFKSLKLTPGNLYELEEGITQNISENFYIRGNNCFPITLRSQDEGQQAFISIPPGVVVSGDFIEIRDIQATGSTTVYAGNFSTDISNNNGWIFNNAPGYIYGFAPDTTVCSADFSMIGTQNFNPDASSTFLWHDGSTGPEYLVKANDTIAWVTVYYADDCSYTDSIDIDHLPSPSVDVGPDTEMCVFDTLFPYQHSDNVSFLWQDGSTKPWTIATGNGIYGLTVTNEFGCEAYDDLFVDVLPSPIVNLGNDTIIHAGEQIVLDAQNPGASYFWSTGDTTQTIIAGSIETYWVDVNKDGCSAFDTIFIDEYPPCILAVPTAFSPNGDGQNDILYVRGDNYLEFELMIFSRWGELVFQTNNSSIGWDGTFKGQPQAVDAYNFILTGRCLDGQITTSKGTITLLR